MDLSIVIPAYDEERKIGSDIRQAAEFLRSRGPGGEIIVVDDGSSDRTAEEAETVPVPAGIERRVIRLGRRSGKGAAVRAGILASRGEIVLYADSGSCVPFEDALPAMEAIRAGRIDAGLASRRHPESVLCRDRPLRRRLISWAFRQAAVLVAGLPRLIKDSQCGFKVYRGGPAREIFAGLATTGFLFEIEFILNALRRGLRLEEFPVRWSCDLDTRLRPGAHGPGIVRELFEVRRLARAGDRSRGGRDPGRRGGSDGPVP